jgi:hypothetical protein
VAEDTKVLEVVLELRDLLSGKLKNAATQAKQTQGIFGGLTKAVTGLVAAYAGYVTIGKFTDFLKASVKAAAEEEAIIISLNAALNSMGNYTAANSASLQKFARDMMKVTTLADDQVLSVMRTVEAYTGLSADALPKAAKASIALANIMKTDVDSAAKLLSRTLNSNVNMIRGTGFEIDGTASKLVKLDQILERSAAGWAMETAKLETTAGAAKQLTVRWGEFQEAIGFSITQSPVIQRMLGMATEQMQGQTAAVDDNKAAYTDWADTVAKVIGKVILAVEQAVNAIRAVFDFTMLGITSVIAVISKGIADLGTMLENAQWHLTGKVVDYKWADDAQNNAYKYDRLSKGYAEGVMNASDTAKLLWKQQQELWGMDTTGGARPTGAEGAAGTAPGAGGAAAKTQQDTIVDAAKAALGTNFYRKVGDKKFADNVCALAVSQILIGAGVPIDLTESTSDLARQLQEIGATRVKLSDAIAGDVVLRRGNAYGTGYEHSQIYAGNGKAYGEPGTSGAFKLQDVDKNSEVWRLSNTAIVDVTNSLEALAAALGQGTSAVTGASHFPASGVTDSSVRASLEIAAQENKDWWTSVVASRGMQGDTLYAPWAPEGGVTVKGQGTYYPSPNKHDPNYVPPKEDYHKNRGGIAGDFNSLGDPDFLMSLAGAGLGSLASGGGAREMASTLLPMIGSAFGPIGAAVGGLLGGLFGKKKQQQPVTEAIPVKIVNLADMATAFLSATQSRRMMATAPGMQRLTTQLNMQAMQVGVV